MNEYRQRMNAERLAAQHADVQGAAKDIIERAARHRAIYLLGDGSG